MKNFTILQVNERVNLAKKAGKEVINGSIGMLFDDNHNLVTFTEINDYLKNNFDKYLCYANNDNSKNFINGVIDWIFEDRVKELYEKYKVTSSITIGGTDALFNSFMLFKDHTILCPAPYWPNYKNIADQAGTEFKEFNAFNENRKFDFENLEKLIKESSKKILLLINDPCNNPTGFNFDKEDYDNLFHIINKYSDKITLLLDIAYLDYSVNRNLVIDFILNNDIKVDILLAFSASKSFGFYGLRLGELIILSKNDVEEYAKKLAIIVRGTVSNPNNVALSTLGLFFNDKENSKIVKEKIKKEALRINLIGQNLIKLLDKKHIEYYPFQGGFYMVIKVKDAYSYLEYLESKDTYFTIVNPTSIRIALCSLTLEDVSKLENIL